MITIRPLAAEYRWLRGLDTIFPDHYFPALLKDENDEVMAEGYAQVSTRERFVEFESDFVPMMPFGSTAKVIRLVEGQEAHCFVGTVYLSSHSLMRIVNVNDSLLAEVELETLQSVSLSARATPIISRNGALRFVAERLLKYEIQVYSISLTKLRFVSTEQFLVGELLQITLPEPIGVRRMAVRITQTLLFGEVKTGYRCEVLSLPEAERGKLTGYLAQNQQVFQDGEEDEEEEDSLLPV